MLRLRRFAKNAVKTAARPLSFAAPSAKNAARILTYHSVGARVHEMNVAPKDFQAQMKWLAENVTLIGVEEALEGQPGIALTFDDGYKDNLTNAAPVLEEYGIPATLFAVTQRVGSHLDHDTPNDDARLLTWDEIRQWRDRGFGVGAHTRTHPRLSRESAEGLVDEIAGCREDLVENLGDPAQGFAYPFGSSLDYDARAVEALQSAGFSYGLSNRYGPVERGDSPWTVRRIGIDRSDTIVTFKAKVMGKLDALRLLDSGAGLRLRRAIGRAFDRAQALAR